MDVIQTKIIFACPEIVLITFVYSSKKMAFLLNTGRLAALNVCCNTVLTLCVVLSLCIAFLQQLVHDMMEADLELMKKNPSA